MRAYNFAAGPSMLPVSVLQDVQAAVGDYHGEGYSILEMMHRKQAFADVLAELQQRVRSLLNVPEDFDIIFCPGGGRMQFAMVPLNLTTPGCRGGYIETGLWSRMAREEAQRVSSAVSLFVGDGRELPTECISVPRDVDYVYFCDNETVDGSEFKSLPELSRQDVYLAADMSSNFMSRPIDFTRYGAIWAGVQKNFGTAGLVCVIVRKSLLGNAGAKVPTMLDWQVYSEANSLANTPPVLQFYVAMLMARWVDEQGGVTEMDRRAKERSQLLYSAIDDMSDFYVGALPPAVRSRMNAVFTIHDSSLLNDFVNEAAAQGMTNLAGHRSVGGLRASLYNVMPIEAVEKLVKFMKDFAGRHGKYY